MNSSSAWEKFQGATLSLVRSGALKDRLTSAYRSHLSLIDEADLPEDLRDDFRILNDAMTREPPTIRGDDAFRATMRKLSNDQAEEIATWVVRMFCALQRPAMPSAREQRITAQVVPLYIAEARVAKG